MRTWRYTQYVGDTRGRSYSLADLATNEGSNVSSVVAASVGDASCTITQSALADNVWTGDVETPNPGRAAVRLTCTLADGEIHVRRFEIDVRGTSISQVANVLSEFDIATG